MTTSLSFQLPARNERLSALCGQLNCNLKQIERHLGVKIINRSNLFNITGDPIHSACAQSVVESLFDLTGQPSKTISRGDVHQVIARAQGDILQQREHSSEVAPCSNGGTMQEQENAESPDEIVIRLRRHVIRGHNPRQRMYLRHIHDTDIGFAIGPAGTGKTYLAVACAVSALTENRIERILLVRPAVEAGEKLGFLPGDIGQKIDPYLRPLFDALYEMLGFDRVGKLIARGTIELAPLAYMRGRTLNESFVILDEAQNTTPEQMKMFLTRIGFGSKAIVTGDITQVDLPRGQLSGLRHARQVLDGIEGISFTHFKPEDVVRHPLVQRIVTAYEGSDDRTGA